ncbi:MAG: metallophosphoesterase family protein [Lachnospiraceae bacterium]|nr:metallophosphoesterase family protein [Lachnospiraceae bacterium]
MSTSYRLDRAFAQAPVLPLSYRSKYVLVSDCHRGVGTSSDNFLKNQHLYFAALEYYYRNGFSYIELGDGEELWENRNLRNIAEIHNDVYEMLSRFDERGRLHLIYGNHDMIQKKNPAYHEALILRSESVSGISLYLTHGHQASLLNSTFWRVARFLVRYFWNPLENIGILDPTSAAKNYEVKEKCEESLRYWAEENKHILITGHTHRPVMPEEPAYYYNTGSCVHPRCITCIEIERGKLTLVKWSMQARIDSVLYVEREVIGGPVDIAAQKSVQNSYHE